MQSQENLINLPRRNFLHLAAGAAALPVVPSASAFGQGTIIPTNATMIVERTQYFAKPGLAARSSIYDARLPPCASRSGFQPVKYSSNILAVTAVIRMRLGNAPAPTSPHATQTSQRVPQARILRAFAYR